MELLENTHNVISDTQLYLRTKLETYALFGKSFSKMEQYRNPRLCLGSIRTRLQIEFALAFLLEIIIYRSNCSLIQPVFISSTKNHFNKISFAILVFNIYITIAYHQDTNK